MELNFKGTPKELHETLRFLYARVKYHEKPSRVLPLGYKTESQIGDIIADKSWLASEIDTVDFFYSIDPEPFASIR